MTKTIFSKIGPLAVVVIIALVSLGAAAFFFQRYQKMQRLLQNPTEAAKEENRALTAKVGKLMDLPAGEDPTVATITDVRQLQDQLFFLKAKNGDKVIIYTNAGKAILYRPSENKIIDVAPINIGSQTTPAASVTSRPTPTGPLIRILLYNGTEVTGLTKTAEQQLKAKFSNLEIVARQNAIRNYERSIIVDLSGKQAEMAQKLAAELKGDIGEFPGDEATPSAQADLIAIIGKEYIK